MSRNGKIARLPGQIREEIDRRLYDGQDGRQILHWLNSVDEVKAVLAEKFDGRPITKGNLFEWRQGGHRDWQAQQATLAAVDRLMSEGLELDKVAKNALADKLAVWLLGRYIVVTRKLIENENDPAAWKLLREICHDVVTLRRGDHGAEWLRIEQERLVLQQRKQESQREKMKEEILKENPPPKVLSDEEKDRRWRQIFGIDQNSHPAYASDRLNQPAPNSSEPSPAPANSPCAFPTCDAESNHDSRAKLGRSVSCVNAANNGGPTPANPDQADLPLVNPIAPILPRSPEDVEAAEFQLLIDRAEHGHAYSAYCLGARYRDGHGAPKDPAKARNWLTKAACQGVGGAKVELHALLMHWNSDSPSS